MAVAEYPRLGPNRCGSQRASRTALVSCLLLGLAGLPAVANAQAAWEFSPYGVQACLAFENQPEFTPVFADRTRLELQSRAEVVFFATWNLDAAIANSKVAGQILTHWEQLSFDGLKAAEPKLLTGDKLYLLAISKSGGEYFIRARELDLRTRMMGPTVERQCGTLQGIPLAAWDALAACFVPLARIETVSLKNVSARVRAGGLITDPASPALIQPGDALRPIVRRNDKTGEPTKNGIQPVAWTILNVVSRTDALLECSIASGYRTPIPTKGGNRIERLAVVARPRLPATRVVLRSRNKDPHPLTGYEIYVKGVDDLPTQLLGVTDWRGSIDVPRGDVLVRTLYVKNGNQLLARLPLVPGDEHEVVATTIEDDFRLQTEGFVTALQARVTDLVARREILAARMRKRIKEGKLGEAEVLLQDYRKLESRDELIKDLDAQQGIIADNDALLEKLTKARIAKMMGEARKLLLNKYLDPETKNVLAKELEKARAGNTAASTGS